MSELQQFSEGSVIFITGERSNGRVYRLVKGTCFLEKIWGVKRIVEQIQVGEFIGMHSSLGGKVRQETCVMQSRGLMKVYSREGFLEILKIDGDLLVKLLRDFCKQLETTYAMFPKKGSSSQPTLWTDNTSANYLKEVGDFYYQQGLNDRALYAYKKYLQTTEVKIGAQLDKIREIVNDLEQQKILANDHVVDPPENQENVEQEEKISSPNNGNLQ